jgi:ATP-dependent Lon protease
VSVAELAVEKGASTVLIPVSARKQLHGLSDEMATRLIVLLYSDAADALLKALGES